MGIKENHSSLVPRREIKNKASDGTKVLLEDENERYYHTNNLLYIYHLNILSRFHLFLVLLFNSAWAFNFTVESSLIFGLPQYSVFGLSSFQSQASRFLSRLLVNLHIKYPVM